ncbi:MAG: TonB-dependent receptor [Chitinophagaceae bacterium]
MRYLLVIFVLAMVPVKILFAQDENTKGNELDPVTVTASVSPVSLSKTGRNITVIKGADFQNLPINSLDDLLRYVPGIEIQARGPMGSQSDIVIRGGTFQQVLLIIDGIRLNDPLTGHFNSYIPIAPAEIERIEILKGASSAIYGTEAVGGVIHIITKSFSSAQKQKGLQAQLTGGQYGLVNINAGGLWTDNTNTVAGGLQSNHADGQQQRGTKGFFDLTTASISYSRKISDAMQLSLRTAYDNRNFAAQNYYTSFKSDTAREKVISQWNHLKFVYHKNKQYISVDAGYKMSSDNYKFSSLAAANQNKSKLFQTLLTYTRELTSQADIVVGGNFLQKKITSNDRGNHRVDQTGAFIILNQQLGQYFSLSPAIRYDYNSVSKSWLVPQVNASYKKNNLQLRASAGNTTRDADFTERYNNYGKALVTSGSIGNPDLKSETSFSYEFGADYLLKNNFKISSSWFQRRQKELIDFVTTPYAEIPRKDNLVSTGTYALAKNISSVNTTGFETDLQFNKHWNNQSYFLANLGLLWLKSRSSSATPSFYISSHAKFLMNFSAAYRYKAFSISCNGIYKERAPNAAAAINATVSEKYFLLNTKAAVAVFKNNLSLFVQADNLLNITYSDLLGTPMPGRWLMGGFQFTFK